MLTWFEEVFSTSASPVTVTSSAICESFRLTFSSVVWPNRVRMPSRWRVAKPDMEKVRV